MSEEKISIEFEKEVLEGIFKEAGVDLPQSPTADDIKNAVTGLKNGNSGDSSQSQEPQKKEVKEEKPKDNSAVNPDDKGAADAQEQTPMDEIKFNGKNVLVVDDLGVVNYQLSCIFKREGFHVYTTTSITSGIEHFKTKRVDIVILDLFLPSEREGIMLLEEIVKLRQGVNKEARIIMMSSDLKPEYKKLCKSLGANKFIEKSTGWHEKIVELCS